MAHPAVTVGNPTRSSDLNNLITDYDVGHNADGTHQHIVFPNVIPLHDWHVMPSAPATTTSESGSGDTPNTFDFSASATNGLNSRFIGLHRRVKASAGLTLRCFLRMLSAEAASVVMNITVYRLPSGGAAASDTTVQAALMGNNTTGQSIVIGLSTVAAEDALGITIERLGANAADTHTAALRLFAAQLEYTYNAP